MDKVGTGHPDVCQANLGNGPCIYRKVVGSSFCTIHCGSLVASSQERAVLRNYTIKGAFAGKGEILLKSPRLKSLVEEVVLVRVALEGVINQITQESEVLLYADKIQSLANTIKSLMEGSQKLQEKNGELIDRTTLFELIDKIITIILKYVSDPDTLALLGTEIYELLAVGNGE